MSESSQMLVEINNAIQKVMVGGQEYQLGSKKLTRADLGMLYEMQKDYQARVQAENGTGTLLDNTSVAFFNGR